LLGRKVDYDHATLKVQNYYSLYSNQIIFIVRK